jgi:hypothetical protein
MVVKSLSRSSVVAVEDESLAIRSDYLIRGLGFVGIPLTSRHYVWSGAVLEWVLRFNTYVITINSSAADKEALAHFVANCEKKYILGLRIAKAPFAFG